MTNPGWSSSKVFAKPTASEGTIYATKGKARVAKRFSAMEGIYFIWK